jgi:hypothetical protein
LSDLYGFFVAGLGTANGQSSKQGNCPSRLTAYHQAQLAHLGCAEDIDPPRRRRKHRDVPSARSGFRPFAHRSRAEAALAVVQQVPLKLDGDLLAAERRSSEC